MGIIITPRTSADGRKIHYTFEWGKKVGQRKASGIFTFVNPGTISEILHNEEALRILEVKKAQMILDAQGIGTGIILQHRFCENFLDFFDGYVKRNRQQKNRHLECCFTRLKEFIKGGYISPVDITEEFCLRFRKYLLDSLNGETPASYFARFKHVIRSATQQGYFRVNPCLYVPVKTNKNKKRKEHLEKEEYRQLLRTPFLNEEVRDAFIFCCYTGLRWCDIKEFTTSFVKDEFTIVQKKTGVEHYIPLHFVARLILDKRMAQYKCDGTRRYLFNLPTANGANKLLKEWCSLAGITKRITWHCARLSFSIVLQDENVDAPTVALLLGHTSTRYVNENYKRYRPKNQMAAIAKLPNPAQVPCFYDVHKDLTLANVEIYLPELNNRDFGKPIQSPQKASLISRIFGKR